MITKQLYVGGMTCASCEMKIEKNLKAINGIAKVKASFVNNTVVVSFDENKVEFSKIKQVIIDFDYKIINANVADEKPFEFYQLGLIAIIVLGVYVVLNHLGVLNIFNQFREAKVGMSFIAIFVIGLLTSVHCVGMCGGICLSQCVNVKTEKKKERMRPSFLYNIGRIICYTIIGGLVGVLGSVISFNGIMRGIVALMAGVFMVIMGLNMLNIFPWLKKLSVRMPKFLVAKTSSNSPFFVGLLNGFMPCGPLQAMQLYALSTGSFVTGAVSMFLFSLGTVPLMFGFGAVISLLSKKFTARIMAISAVLVILLGVGMFNTGISMSGFLGIGTEKGEMQGFEPQIVDGYQIVKIEVSPNAYAPIVVKKDIPVKFNIHAEEKNLNGCNSAIRIPEFNIQMSLSPGDNIVKFTPTKTGVFSYTCWMNMIRSSISVVD